jgi:ABC-type transport system substrate-binding protein
MEMATMDEQRRRQELEERLRAASATRLNRRRLLTRAAGSAAGATALAAAGWHAGDASAQDATPGASPVASPAASPGASPVASPDVSPVAMDAQQIFYNQIMQDDPSSFDFNADLYVGAEVECWAGLLTFDADGVPVPDWAETFSSNEDGSVWTFNIRPNNRGWTNGDPVTAHDFVWSFTRILSLEPLGATGQNSYSFILYDIKNAESFSTGDPVVREGDPLNGRVATEADLGIRAIDDWTLEVTLEGPRANFAQKVAYYACVPAHRPSVEQHGAEWALGNIPLVSNGPFKLDRWEKGVKCLLSKHEGYWDAERIRLTNVVDPIVPGDSTVVTFTSGQGDLQLDWATIGASDLGRFQEDPALAPLLRTFVYPGIWMLLPSNGVPPFDDLQVRRALSHAIDRQRLATLTNDLVIPGYCMVPPGVYGFLDDPALEQIQNFDPALAMQALVGTPYEGGQNWPEIEILMRGNEQLYNSNLMINDIVAQLQENLGMSVTINELVENPFRDALLSNTAPLVWIRWWYDYPDPDNGYYDMFYGGKPAGSKRQAWENEEFDRLAVQAKGELDPDARLALYRRCEEIIQTDVGYIPVCYRVDQNAFKPWVKNAPVNQQGFTVPDGNIYVRALTQYYVSGRE